MPPPPPASTRRPVGPNGVFVPLAGIEAATLIEVRSRSCRIPSRQQRPLLLHTASQLRGEVLGIAGAVLDLSTDLPVVVSLIRLARVSPKRPQQRLILEMKFDVLLAGIALGVRYFLELMLVLPGLLPELGVFNSLGAIRVMHLVKLCDMLSGLILQLSEQTLDFVLVVVLIIHRLQLPLLKFLQLHRGILQL